MAKDSPTHPHATGDDNNSSNAQPIRTRDRIRDFIGLPKSKSKGLKNKSSTQSLNTQDSAQTTGMPLNISQSTVILAKINHSGSPSSPVENATPAPSTRMKNISGIFSKDLPKPTIKTDLPGALDRIEVTQQLVYAQRLILDGQSIVSSGVTAITERPTSDSTNQNTPTALDKKGWMPDRAERAWIKSQDPMQQHHLQGLVDNVVAEFAKDDLKGSAAIAEVVILGPILDRNTYRRLLNHLVIRFKQDIYFDVPLLQGLVQLIEDASPGYLEHGDLVDTLGILRERLKQLHKPSSEKKDFAKDKSSFTDKSAGDHALSLDHKASFEQLYQITIAISRLLDVMVNNEVKNVDRISVHQSLVAALAELEDITDPILQLQVQYALQASQYIPDNESTLQAVLRFGGGTFMFALGAVGICKLDPENLFSSLDNLRQAAGEAYAVVKQLPEGLEAFQQGRSGAARSLLHGMRTGTKREWYLTLLFARTYVRHGQLAKFNQTVYGARCGDNQAFQLGVCQILGEVAMDPLWDTTIRQQAVDFLAALCGPTTGWKQHFAVKEWIVVILTHLSALSDTSIKDYAQGVLQGLVQEGIDPTSISTNTSFALESRLPLPESSPLLVRAQKIPYLEYDLHRLKIQRIEESHQRIYIPPMAKANLQAQDEDSFSLMDKVKEFLTSEREVMLILGDSGAGKSTFSLHLENQLWTNYSTGDPIPLHINLPAIRKSVDDMVTKQLQMHNFTDEQIIEMKQHRKFILICDGYDESQLTVNLHKTNRLNRQGQWRAKMIISCRTQFLGSVYLDRFVPQGSNHYQYPAIGLFQEAVITPFSKEQVEDYVGRYVPLEPRPWATEDYMRILTTIPDLMDLVKNPFLLTLSLEALPGVTKNRKDLNNIKISRVQLYDHFVDQWLSVNMRRLRNSLLSKEDMAMLDQLIESNILTLGADYSTRLAAAIFDKHDGNPVVQYIQLRDQSTWKDEFFGLQPRVRLLRESSPLKRTGNLFSFIHRSMLEYFFSRCIYNPVRTDEEFDVQVETMTSLSQIVDADGPLFQRNLLKEPSVIQFLCDRVKQSPIFEQKLRAVIDQSKTDTSATTAATNAITILVRAEVSFNGADLRGVRIPGADLSNGQFDSTQFQGADLTEANLTRSWLRQADFSSANLKDMKFGELPYLELKAAVTTCCFSPNGEMLGMAGFDGVIYIYDTSTWTMIHCLEGHVDAVRSIAFSPDSHRLASGSDDKTIRLWDTTSGEGLLVMEGHSDIINSVAISPCGSRIASGSGDKTARLWDAQTGECLFVLEGHGSRVASVKYSPDGRQVVSISWDGTLRRWDCETGELVIFSILSSSGVSAVAYSPDGRWIAVSYSGTGMRIFDAASLEPYPVLSGHTGPITGIDFSPDGKWIASSSSDHTVRLWDVSTGNLVSIMAGHIVGVNDMSFSRDSLRIASAGFDRKVRLWEVSSVWSRVEQQDQVRFVLDVIYTVDGQDILYCSHNTVQQCSALTGVPGSVLFNLPDPDQCVSMCFSPDGRQIAAGTVDNCMKLWSLQDGVAAGPRLLKYDAWIDTMTFSLCGRWIVSCDNGKIRLRDLHDLDQGHTLLSTIHESIDDYAQSAAFTPNGHHIAVGYSSGTIRTFDPHTGDLLITKRVVDEALVSLAYSPCGLQLAVGTRTGSIHLCDLHSEKPSIELEGHIKWICSIAYSTCGEWITSGCSDQIVLLWHRRQDTADENWSCAASVRGFFGDVEKIIWNPVVPLEFATACEDRSLRVWRISNADGKIVVKMLWGFNLRMLCAADMILTDATGLNPIQQKLLLQRGAIGSAQKEEKQLSICNSSFPFIYQPKDPQEIKY